MFAAHINDCHASVVRNNTLVCPVLFMTREDERLDARPSIVACTCLVTGHLHGHAAMPHRASRASSSLIMNTKGQISMLLPTTLA